MSNTPYVPLGPPPPSHRMEAPSNAASARIEREMAALRDEATRVQGLLPGAQQHWQATYVATGRAALDAATKAIADQKAHLAEVQARSRKLEKEREEALFREQKQADEQRLIPLSREKLEELHPHNWNSLTSEQLFCLANEPTQWGMTSWPSRDWYNRGDYERLSGPCCSCDGPDDSITTPNKIFLLNVSEDRDNAERYVVTLQKAWFINNICGGLSGHRADQNTYVSIDAKRVKALFAPPPARSCTIL